MGRITGLIGHLAEGYKEEDLTRFLARCHRSEVVAGVSDTAILGPGYGLSVRGEDHFRSPDGRYICLLDASLASAEVLAGHLGSQGFAASGGTRAEVFTDAFLRHGVSFLKHLKGSFAAAVFDTQEQSLFLAVDPYGLKRLYIADLPDGLVFSSDLTGLARSGWAPLTIGDHGVREYFSLGFISPPWTIYRDIMSLPVGEYLTWNGKETTRQTYHKVIGDGWQFRDVAGWSEQDLLDKLENLVVEAVASRLPADGTPIAAYLSGGQDTGLLNAVLRRRLGRQVTAFTLGCRNSRHDEVPRARRVAMSLGIDDHRCVYLEEDECFAALDELPDLYAQPMADISAIPNLVITRAVARDFTAVFAGDGPDGLYGNWDLRPWYYYYRLVPTWLRRPIAQAVDWTDRSLGLGLSSPTRCVSDLLQQEEFSWVLHKKFTGRRLSELLGRPIEATEFELGRYLRDRPDIPLYERLRMGFAKYFIMHGVLLKAGAVHDAMQVQQVCPYYDRELVDVACTLPTRYKTRGRGYGKYLHTKLLERFAPSRVWRGRKQGFIFDIHDFDRRRMNDLVERYLAPDRIRETGVLNGESVRHLREEYLGGALERAPLVMTILGFELWRERFLD